MNFWRPSQRNIRTEAQFGLAACVLGCDHESETEITEGIQHAQDVGMALQSMETRELQSLGWLPRSLTGLGQDGGGKTPAATEGLGRTQSQPRWAVNREPFDNPITRVRIT